MSQNFKDISNKMLAGGIMETSGEDWAVIWKIIDQTIELSVALNTSTSVYQIRQRLSNIINSKIDDSTRIFIPFYTNFGRHIRIGKNVFINHACPF